MIVVCLSDGWGLKIVFHDVYVLSWTVSRFEVSEFYIRLDIQKSFNRNCVHRYDQGRISPWTEILEKFSADKVAKTGHSFIK